MPYAVLLLKSIIYNFSLDNVNKELSIKMDEYEDINRSFTYKIFFNCILIFEEHLIIFL